MAQKVLCRATTASFAPIALETVASKVAAAAWKKNILAQDANAIVTMTEVDDDGIATHEPIGGEVENIGKPI